MRAGQTDGQTDGHGDFSIPLPNFVAGGIIKSWWKPSPGQADQLHTLQHSPHTCIHKWREGTTGQICTPPLKNIVGAMRHSP